MAREIHHAVAVDRSGRRLADRPLPNDETALRDLFTELAVHGRLLVVVDQPASIGSVASSVTWRTSGLEEVRSHDQRELGERCRQPERW